MTAHTTCALGWKLPLEGGGGGVPPAGGSQVKIDAKNFISDMEKTLFI
jgi:hypothetical protein